MLVEEERNDQAFFPGVPVNCDELFEAPHQIEKIHEGTFFLRYDWYWPKERENHWAINNTKISGTRQVILNFTTKILMILETLIMSMIMTITDLYDDYDEDYYGSYDDDCAHNDDQNQGYGLYYDCISKDND